MFPGYIFVTREHCEGRYRWCVCLCGLHFCNPQTDGRVVGGGVWVTSLQHANKGMARYDVGCVYVCGVIELKRSIMWCSALGCLLLVS